MIKINRIIEEELYKENKRLGFYCEEGAVIGYAEFIVVIKKDANIYLAHRSEFIFKGVLIKLRGE